MKTLGIKEVEGGTEIEVETGFWIFKKVATYRRLGLVKGGFVWGKRLNNWANRRYSIFPEKSSIACKLEALSKAELDLYPWKPDIYNATLDKSAFDAWKKAGV